MERARNQISLVQETLDALQCGHRENIGDAIRESDPNSHKSSERDPTESICIKNNKSQPNSLNLHG